MVHNMSNMSTADIVVLNPHFQDWIQFFILVFAVSSILLVYNSVVFPTWMRALKENCDIAPTNGRYILCSTAIIGLCLFFSCVFGTFFFTGISYSTMFTFFNMVSGGLWLLLSLSVIFMFIDIYWTLIYLLRGDICDIYI